MKQKILNIEVDNVSLYELLRKFKSGLLVTPNVDHLITLQINKEFYRAYRSADFVTVDSQIVFFALKWLGRGVKEKISGSDFLPAFCNFHADLLKANQPALRPFLLGGKSDVAIKAMTEINARNRIDVVVGCMSPSMNFVSSESECQEAIKLINQSGATALVVGLGAPKQELWIARYRQQLPLVKVFLAVGASIDFEAKVIERAPKWMSRFGVEWLFRLYKEPRRMWHRYLVRDPLFFWLLIQDKLNRYKNPFSSV